MAKQEELRALVNAFKSAVHVHARYAYLDGPVTKEPSKVAEQRIFSFFDQMRQTIDGLSADVENSHTVRKALIAERDEAVRQIKELFPKWQEACAERDQLRKDAAPVVEDTFVPFEPGRENLEVLIGMPDADHWLPAHYIGTSSIGFHVVEVEGRGIVGVSDAAVGLRHRVKAKTVTLHVNVYKRDDQYSAGCISVDRNESLNQMTDTDYLGTFPVTVTVAE